jgi:hypothetical protein
VQCRERHAAKERLARQPDHHVGILAERPQQRELLQARERFPENVDALRLERVEMIHGGLMGARSGRDLPDRISLGRVGPTQLVRGGILVEKMHLLDLGLWR